MQHNTEGFGVIWGRCTMLKLLLTSDALNKAAMVKLHAINRSLDIQQT